MFTHLVFLFLYFHPFFLIAPLPPPPHPVLVLCSVLLPSILPSDHERKIELVRFLIADYVNVHVLDAFSEHANALASSAVATFQAGADPGPSFLSLPVPGCQSERAPKRHG